MAHNKYVKELKQEKIKIVAFTGKVGNWKDGWPSNSEDKNDCIIDS